MSCNLKKKTWGANAPSFVLLFQRLCGDYQCGGAPVRVFEKFCSSFSFLPFFLFFSFFFFFFFSFLHFLFCLSLSLSGALLAPGPMDIVHPCHPVATPLAKIFIMIKLLHSFFTSSLQTILDCLGT